MVRRVAIANWGGYVLGVHSDDTGERLNRYMSYISGNDQSGWAVSFVHGNSLEHARDGFDVTGNARIQSDILLSMIIVGSI